MFNIYFTFYRSLRVTGLGWHIAVALIFVTGFSAANPLVWFCKGLILIDQGPVDCSRSVPLICCRSGGGCDRPVWFWLELLPRCRHGWNQVPVNWAAVLVYKAKLADGSRRFYEILWIWETFGRGRRRTTNHDFSRRSQSIFEIRLNISAMGKSPQWICEFWRKDGLERLGRHDSGNLFEIWSQLLRFDQGTLAVKRGYTHEVEIGEVCREVEKKRHKRFAQRWHRDIEWHRECVLRFCSFNCLWDPRLLRKWRCKSSKKRLGLSVSGHFVLREVLDASPAQGNGGSVV